MAQTSYDAVVVGSGPNGLTAAALLAMAGCSVLVREAEATPGGGARTAELTLPGFRHDICSAVHPLGAGSPVFRALPLQEHGLHWIDPPVAMAQPMERGSSLALQHSLRATGESLGLDAAAYRRLVSPFLGHWDALARDALRPVAATLPRHPLLLARFGLRALLPVSALAATMRGQRGAALLAGLAAHAISPPTSLTTGGVALLFAVAGHEVGWPFPRGGSQAITDSLVALLTAHGGRLECAAPVRTLRDLPAARAVLLDTAPWHVPELAGAELPDAYCNRLRRWPHGPAVFKIDYALSAPVPWRDEQCRTAGTVHIGASYAEITAALRAVARGEPPRTPFLITSQPSLFDEARAPQDRHTFWVYGHVPQGWDGDLTDAIERQVERFAPGFRDTVLARSVAGPRVLEQRNRNDVGGDIGGGAFSGHRSLFRPVLRPVPYATPNPRIFLCSSSTPPGPGVHGICGYYAAKVVLRRVFERPLPI